MTKHDPEDQGIEALGFELDPGRPPQTASLIIHPEKADTLDDLLDVFNDFIRRARANAPHPELTIVLKAVQLKPMSELQQYWNGDTMRLEITYGSLHIEEAKPE